MEHVVERSLMDEFRREEILASLRRIERQIHEVGDLVDMNQCDTDVLLQLSLIGASARRVSRLVLLQHIHRQLDNAVDQPNAIVREITLTIARFNRIVS